MSRLLLILLAFPPGLWATETPRAVLHLSHPPGSCTLTLLDNGGGQLHYGAAARRVTFPAGTFAVPSVRARALSLVQTRPTDGSQHAPDYATVLFPPDNQPRWITAVSWVRQQLEQGWLARRPAPPASADDVRWIKQACDFPESDRGPNDTPPA